MKTSLLVIPAGKARPKPVFFAPADDAAEGVGIAVSVHGTHAETLGVTIALSIPEAAERFDDVMETAKTLNARVVMVCNTNQQATDIAKRVAAALPDHRRISISDATAGGWGLG